MEIMSVVAPDPRQLGRPFSERRWAVCSSGPSARARHESNAAPAGNCKCGSAEFGRDAVVLVGFSIAEVDCQRGVRGHPEAKACGLVAGLGPLGESPGLEGALDAGSR